MVTHPKGYVPAALRSHRRGRQGSAEVGVNHQPKHRQASAEAETSSLSRRHTGSSYGSSYAAGDLNSEPAD
jgi:hypothetical protein